MRTVVSAASLVLVFTLLACAPPVARETVGQDSPEIAARSVAWIEAFQAKDVEALAMFYTEDCRVLPPNAEMGGGRDAVRAAFGEMFAAGLGGDLGTVEATAAGDVGYHVGTYMLETADGTEVDRGKFIEVWRKVDGEWLIANDIWNSDLPVAVPEMEHDMGDMPDDAP